MPFARSDWNGRFGARRAISSALVERLLSPGKATFVNRRIRRAHFAGAGGAFLRPAEANPSRLTRGRCRQPFRLWRQSYAVNPPSSSGIYGRRCRTKGTSARSPGVPTEPSTRTRRERSRVSFLWQERSSVNYYAAGRRLTCAAAGAVGIKEATMRTQIPAIVGFANSPWNKAWLIGQKRPLKPKEVWAIRVRLQLEQRSVISLCSISRSTASCAGVTSCGYG